MPRFPRSSASSSSARSKPPEDESEAVPPIPFGEEPRDQVQHRVYFNAGLEWALGALAPFIQRGKQQDATAAVEELKIPAPDPDVVWKPARRTYHRCCCGQNGAYRAASYDIRQTVIRCRYCKINLYITYPANKEIDVGLAVARPGQFGSFFDHPFKGQRRS